MALALAALAGFTASPPWRLSGAARFAALLPAAALALSFIMAAQQLQAARTLAVWAAYLCVFLHAAGLARHHEGPAEPIASGAGRWVLGALALAATGLSLHGLYQSLYAFERMAAAARELGLPEAVRARLGSERAVATLGLPDALSGFLALSIPITCWLARLEKSAVRRGALWCGVALQAACLLATRSAGGFASLALAGAVVIWWRGRIGRGAARRRLAIALVAAGLAGAGLLLVLRLSGPGSEGAGNPLSLRQSHWQVALAIAREHPLLGAGPGCYGICFPPHRQWGMNESQFVHNSYLQVLSETGALVTLFAVGAAGLLAWWLLSAGVPPWLAVACLSFLVHNAADFTFYVPTVGFAFFILAGLAVGPRAAGATHRRGPLRAAAAVSLAVFALLVTRADMKRDAARDTALAGDAAAALPQAREAVRSNPFDPESRSLVSRLLLEAGVRANDSAALGEAEEQARRATELDPRTPHHWNHLGHVLLARGDRQGAYIALAEAARLYPIRIEYRDERDKVGRTLAGAAPAGETPPAAPAGAAR